MIFTKFYRISNLLEITFTPVSLTNHCKLFSILGKRFKNGCQCVFNANCRHQSHIKVVPCRWTHSWAWTHCGPAKGGQVVTWTSSTSLVFFDFIDCIVRPLPFIQGLTWGSPPCFSPGRPRLRLQRPLARWNLRYCGSRGGGGIKTLGWDNKRKQREETPVSSTQLSRLEWPGRPRTFTDTEEVSL